MNKRLEQIKVRLAGVVDAGLKNWRVDTDDDGRVYVLSSHPVFSAVAWACQNFDMEEHEMVVPMAEFIAHSREDIPWLIAQAERLAEAQRLLGEYEKYDHIIRMKHVDGTADYACRFCGKIFPTLDQVSHTNDCLVERIRRFLTPPTPYLDGKAAQELMEIEIRGGEEE